MTRTPNKQKLFPLTITKAPPKAAPYLVWDTEQKGLALRVETSGYKSYKVIYAYRGRTRWLNLAAANAIGLADARRMAGKVMVAVAEGKDPAAERRAQRDEGTFEQLADRYLEYAKRKNRSWPQARALVERFLLPRWSKLPAAGISRGDTKTLLASIGSATVSNQVLASASALFSWAVREEFGGVTTNPCSKIERNETRSRERVLSAAELPLFWSAFDSAGLVASTALKCLLLLGQRPGEICHMRREHITDGWWELPGKPDPKLGWLGTKNNESHRIWLPVPVQSLLAELDDESAAGFVFAGARGKPLTSLDGAMRAICKNLGVERATPHDLRRTHGSTVTALGLGRDVMNRIQNHKEGGIGDVYDRYQYTDEIKHAMEAVAAHIMRLATDEAAESNVVALRG